MFARRYFAPRYFADRYFPPLGGEIITIPIQSVDLSGIVDLVSNLSGINDLNTDLTGVVQ